MMGGIKTKAFLSVSIWLTLSVLLNGMTASEQMRFMPLNSVSLPTHEVKSLYQDTEGFIWIVTYEGLVRYDGFKSTAYTLLSDIEEGYIFDGQIHTIAEAESGRLYIGTDKGILTMNTDEGVMRKMNDPAIEHLNVSDIIADGAGRIWVGGDKGIFRKDSDSGFARIDLRTGNTNEPITDIVDMLIDSDENLWLTSWKKGLYRYELKSSRLFHYSEGPLSHAYVLHNDSNGNLWIGTWSKGLIRMTLAQDLEKESQFTLYRHDNKRQSSILDDIIYDIDQDEQGRIWVGNRSGLSILENPDKDIFINKFPEPDNGGLPYNEVNAILKTRDNSIWLGMMGGGVCRLERSPEEDATWMEMDMLQKAYKTSSIKGMYLRGTNDLWLGLAGHGIIRYDIEDGEYTNYTDIRGFKGFQNISNVDCIIERSSSGEICFCTYNDGLWLYNPDTGRTSVVNSTTRHGFGSNNIFSLMEDNEGNIWMGTSSGAYILDRENNLVSISERYGLNHNETAAHKILDIDASKHNEAIWMATNHHGIARLDVKEKSLKIYTSQDNKAIKSYNSILNDSRGQVWAGSLRDGLFRYDTATDAFIRVNCLTLLEGKGIYNLEESPDGCIWVTTNDTVISFRSDDSGKIEPIFYYCLSEQNSSVSFNRNSHLYLADKDVVAFGCTKGIIMFPCGHNDVDNTGSDIAITEFLINGKHEKIVHGTLPAEKINIGHDQNDFAISFSLFNFTGSDSNIFKYRLIRKGDNKSEQEWNILYGRNNTAAFHSVASGRYIFQVCGKHSGDSNYSRIKEFEIYVRPVPWLSWWAMIIYLLTVMVLIGSITYLGIRHQHLKNKFRRYRNAQQKREEEQNDRCQLVFDIKEIDYTPLNIKFMQKAVDVANEHIGDSEFRQADFAEAMAVSKTVLTEKLKQLTGLTPAAFLMNARLTLAHKIIMDDTERMRVSDLAYSVGFSDAKYFSKKFKSKYGKTPREMLNEKK